MAGPGLAVIDASVAAKWFLSEAESESAIALRDAHVAGRIRLIAPSLMPYEVANALRYHPRIGSDFLAVYIADLFALGIGIDPVSDGSMAAAIKVAYRTGLTVYDACYVSLADRLGCPLFTADEVQLAAAGPSGQHIREWAREGR